jgi:preprotein translocase subunit SecD
MTRLVLLGIAACAFVAATPAFARTFTIGGEAFSETEILDARAQPDMSGMASVLVSFDTIAAKRIAKMTQDRVGKPLRVELDGRLLVEPVVRAPITDGQVMISGTFSVVAAVQLAKQISGKDPLPDSLDEETP